MMMVDGISAIPSFDTLSPTKAIGKAALVFSVKLPSLKFSSLVSVSTITFSRTVVKRRTAS